MGQAQSLMTRLREGGALEYRAQSPAFHAKQESPEDIKAHLIRINPGFKPPQESLVGPTMHSTGGQDNMRAIEDW